MIRWWNIGRYERECVDFDERMRFELRARPATVRALTESGLELQVRLYTYHPLYCGTAVLV